MQELQKELIEILACPKCKAKARQVSDTIRCTNQECGLAYPIRDGIPVMIVEDAAPPSRETN